MKELTASISCKQLKYGLIYVNLFQLYYYLTEGTIIYQFEDGIHHKLCNTVKLCYCNNSKHIILNIELYLKRGIQLDCITEFGVRMIELFFNSYSKKNKISNGINLKMLT